MPGEFTARSLTHPSPEPDDAAMATLYDRLAPALRGIAARILPSTGIEGQVVETAFLELANGSASAGARGGKDEAKLVLATRDAAVERLRSRRKLPPCREQRASVRQVLEECLPTARQVELMSSRRELVKRLVNQLPAPQRTVLDLVLFEGYSEEETARVLNEPLGRIKDQVRASLAFVRQRLRVLMGTWTADI
ncbi:MAG: sigma factor-like helix-turn-helix DNA-binding protein [Terriglobia bacterium]